MTGQKESWGDRFYRGLLRILPFDFRQEFGDEMEETFREQRADTVRASGTSALLKMWWSTILDIFRMAPREHLSVLSQDARYAGRMMRKNFGYTVGAILILGLGIGANTAIFSVVNSVLLKPLPYLHGDRLVVLRQQAQKLGINDTAFSVSEINDYRTRSRSLTGLVEYHSMAFTLFGGDAAHRVRTGVVSPDFFEFFGVKPRLGRTFVADDDRPGAQPVLILSYEYWKQSEHGDPNIIGRTYRMNDKPHIVVGVLPPIPQYPDENDVYMPTSACPFRSNPNFIANRDSRMMSVFARMKPEATLEHSRADMCMVADHLRKDFPKSYPDTQGYQAALPPLREDLTARARPMLLLLLGAAAFVLLIACANVANLTMARMARREQELMIRTAVGAGSGRLLRQLLTENLLLALLASGVGLAFAYGSLQLLIRFASQLTPRSREIAIDGPVLAFTILCAFVTTVVFGSVAALYSRHDVAAGLKEGSRTTAERTRTLVRRGLIAAQVAFSFVLLVGAGLMVRSFVELSRQDPGFVPQRAFAAGIFLDFSNFNTAPLRLSAARRILEKVQAQPGVLSAAISSSFPLDPENTVGPGASSAQFRVQGDPTPDSQSPPVSVIRSASPDYFRVLGVPLMAGRVFRESDDTESQPVTLINQSLAKMRWPRENPIGKRISFTNGHTWLEIVGIVGDVKELGLGREVLYQVYRPLAQSPGTRVVLVRTAGNPRDFSGQLRRAIAAADPQIAIDRMETMEDVRAESVAPPRTLTTLFALFAGLALVIAVFGIGCMLALWVRQRIHEIGIRVALGASPFDILGIVIRQGMLLVILGLLAGVAGALALTRLMTKLLFHVEPTDAATYAAVCALFLAASFLACWIPARRAARIDPLTALRSD
jgi:putative ABC transport system permease protein